MPRTLTKVPCEHPSILYTPSQHAEIAGYTHLPLSKRLAATTSSGRSPKDSSNILAPSPYTFPAPLVLPRDELSYDPSYPPQSFRSWKSEKERNPVTADRRTIYVAAAPVIEKWDDYIQSWTRSHLLGKDEVTSQPNVQDIVEYLAAVYHPLPVKEMDAKFRLASWDGSPPLKKKAKSSGKASCPEHVALVFEDEATRVRVRYLPPRPSSDDNKADEEPVYSYQLNLDDVLDGVIAALPDDAYSLLLISEHDLYEREEDDFCCGRAYGGSRVAVVTTARYHPPLDRVQGLLPNGNEGDMEGHINVWPASRCAQYVKSVCEAESEVATIKHKGKSGASKSSATVKAGQTVDELEEDNESPTRLALKALMNTKLPKPFLSWPLLHLYRVALTSAHELGHTLGLDHCVYYACLMGGTASLLDDKRSGVPYLCHVCSVKIGWAAGVEGEGRIEKINENEMERIVRTVELQRCTKLKLVCQKRKEEGMFRAYGGWLDGRIAELEQALQVLN